MRPTRRAVLCRSSGAALAVIVARPPGVPVVQNQSVPSESRTFYSVRAL
jgi:hypothetical protein